MAQGITTKKQDTPEWYEQVVLKSEIADFGDVKGTIIIRPKGYFIWQRIQDEFNAFIKSIGVENAYFPLFIPERFFKKEAEHAKGFAPELAWVQTAVQEDSKEKAILRPTSETLIIDHVRQILRNYKQLPIKLNQWCNIVRWEVKQTKLFLRGREFLWQEGHCFYETDEECQRDVLTVLDAYVRLCKDVLAVPVLHGEKTERERFPGAKRTYTIEGIMPDGKALQMGTSHNLGQNFSNAFGAEFVGIDEQKHVPFYNSWGISTRLIGATIMTHSDDKGLVLPPNLVKRKIVVVPVVKKDLPIGFNAYVESVHQALVTFGATIDATEKSLGFKLSEHELMGVPLIVIIGAQEMQQHTVTLKYRDGVKLTVSRDSLVQSVATGLVDMHERLYKKAYEEFISRIADASSREEFAQRVSAGNVVRAFCAPTRDVEEDIENTYGVTSRCMEESDGVCIFTGKPTKYRIYFGKSY